MTLPVTKDSFLSIEAKNKKMDLLKFFENFNTEEKCKEYFLSVKIIHDKSSLKNKMISYIPAVHFI